MRSREFMVKGTWRIAMNRKIASTFSRRDEASIGGKDTVSGKGILFSLAVGSPLPVDGSLQSLQPAVYAAVLVKTAVGVRGHTHVVKHAVAQTHLTSSPLAPAPPHRRTPLPFVCSLKPEFRRRSLPLKPHPPATVHPRQPRLVPRLALNTRRKRGTSHRLKCLRQPRSSHASDRLSRRHRTV